MKVAFVGKGGSGKTTLAALFIRHLAALGRSVVAIDADINQHLGEALAMTPGPAMGAGLPEIKEYLRGDNPRIASAAAMVKTTPPGRGSRLLRVDGDDPIHERFAARAGALALLVTGHFDDEDLGVSCYHSKSGAVELYLNHLVDGPGEYVVVDMTAGAESFASGMFTKFDLTFLVAEPTRKAMGVYEQWMGYAKDFDVAVAVVGNKVQGSDDVHFLQSNAGGDLLASVDFDPAIRAMEQGRPFALRDLGEGNRKTLARLQDAVDARPKDWAKYARQAAEFHRKNARAWANRATGEDLEAQIDPGFVLVPGSGSA